MAHDTAHLETLLTTAYKALTDAESVARELGRDKVLSKLTSAKVTGLRAAIGNILVDIREHTA